jgi:hypothetical protein
MSTVTRWFSIDDDGQPTLPGWYLTLYKGDREDSPDDWSYWDGRKWRWGPGKGLLAFGNESTAGERWRGLAKDPTIKASRDESKP